MSEETVINTLMSIYQLKKSVLGSCLHLTSNFTVCEKLKAANTCCDRGTVTGMSLTKPLVAIMCSPLEKGSQPFDPFEGKKCFIVMDL